MHRIYQKSRERKLLLGMVHLPPLPGSPGAAGRPMREVVAGAVESATRDARALLEGGLDGFLIENFGDTPFYPGPVPPAVVAAMANIAARLLISLESSDPGRVDRSLVGVNVLRNDAAAALAIATACDLGLIRVNVHCGAMVTDQGVIEGRAFETLRERERLGAPVAILADVLVKHAAPLAVDDRDPGALARETAERGGADALIVSGEATGSPADLEVVRCVKDAVPDRPVLVGSGVTTGNVRSYLERADGCIVGTSLKEKSDVRRPVDAGRVRELVRQVRGS